jgi:ribosome-associated translation inhibitor RaiA
LQLLVKGGCFFFFSRAGVCSSFIRWGCLRPLWCYTVATRLALSFKEQETMPDNSRFTIICPCCEATITLDAQTGAIISHEEKTKPVASFDEMLKGLDKQKQQREQIFQQELGSLKDRERLLEEKFREAMKRAEKDKDKPYINPMDVD